MVFLTAVRWMPFQPKWKVSPSRFQKRLMFKRLGAKYFGRARNCYTITLRVAHRALRYATQDRPLKEMTKRRLDETRIAAACLEHNMDKNYFLQALIESNIALNRTVLADLAIYEPRTFQMAKENHKNGTQSKTRQKRRLSCFPADGDEVS